MDMTLSVFFSTVRCHGVSVKLLALYALVNCLWVVAVAQSASSQSSKVITFTLLEELPVGTLVGNIKNELRNSFSFNSTVLRELQFRFRSGSEDYLYFVIEESSGKIYTAEKIDREKICSSQLLCGLNLDVIIGPVKYFQIIKVVVNITDVNDNEPVFASSHVWLEISETTAPGAMFSLPSAVDRDFGQFGIQEYYLYNDSSKFDLMMSVRYDGAVDVQLKLIDWLDREVQEVYLLILIAADGGTPRKTGACEIRIVVGDANDNSPKFDSVSYDVQIIENELPSGPLLKVHATDLDSGSNGIVSYSFAEHTPVENRDTFAINNRTGELYLRRRLDFEERETYVLTIQATDQGYGSLPAFTKVTVKVIDQNDNVPYIELNSLTADGVIKVRENSAIGTFAAYVSVSDVDSGDGGKTTCFINSTVFELKPLQQSQYKIVASVEFDREERSEYSFFITCSDNGKPPLSVSKPISIAIEDINDHVPEFLLPDYTVRIPENSNIRDMVIQLAAADQDAGLNAKLVFNLQPVGGTDDGVMTINPNSGLVSLAMKLDYEKTKSYTYVATVSDSGTPPLSSSVSVFVNVVDVNDEAPRLDKSYYHFSVMENISIGSSVGVVSATDDDDSPEYREIQFSIFGEHGTFAVHPKTGTISTTSKLDREKVPFFRFGVSACNPGDTKLCNSANVTIYLEDINDNPPEIRFPTEKNRLITVLGGAAEGSLIARIDAIDKDEGSNAALTYDIANGNEKVVFVINHKTGVITLASSARHESEFYRLVVTVTDQGTPPLMTVEDLLIKFNSSTSPHVASHPADSSFTASKENLIIIAALPCAVVIIICLLGIAVVVVCRYRRIIRKKENQRLEAIRVMSNLSLRKDAHSYTADYIRSQSSLTAGSRRTFSRDGMSSGPSEVDQDDYELDNIPPTRLLRAEHIDKRNTSQKELSDSSTNTTGHYGIPAGLSNVHGSSCPSMLHAGRRRKSPRSRRPGTYRYHDRRGSKPRYTSRSDVETKCRRRSDGESESGRSVSNVDSGMDPSEDSDYVTQSGRKTGGSSSSAIAAEAKPSPST